MFSQNPNSTPIWLLMIFAAIAVFGYPRIKKIVSKYVNDDAKQSLYTLIVWLVIAAVVVTLSMLV